MFNWFLQSYKDLTVVQQLVIDVVKIALTFGTVLLVTRWTLSRADRKDAIARQALALDAYSGRRIENLNHAVTSVTKILQNLNRCHTVLISDIDPARQNKLLKEFLSDSESHIDELLLATEEYGFVPESLPNDFDCLTDAISEWLRDFYEARSALMTETSLGRMYGLCRELQMELRWLASYEINMRLQVGLNPASAWNPGFGNFLENNYLTILSKDKPWDEECKTKVIGTVLGVNNKKDKRSKKVLIFQDYTDNTVEGDQNEVDEE